MPDNSETKIIYLASNNSHKLTELNALMCHLGVLVQPAKVLQSDIDWDESGQTFADNARIKARAVKALTTRGCVLADDSGLEVEALGGAPGIYSSRFSKEGDDESNNKKLLAELRGVPTNKRQARFVCSLIFIDEKDDEYMFEGTCEGIVLESAKGTKGFGYDPLFFIPKLNKTMAELTLEEKNKISHRAKALQSFLKWYT